MRKLGRQLGQFLFAGLTALFVDTCVLYAALGLGIDYFTGRALSFTAAVFVSWQINRRFTFAHANGGSAWRQWCRYFGVYLVGGAVNYLTYVIVIMQAPPHPLVPMLAVAAGSLVGMPVNFLSAKLLVFRHASA